MTCFRPVIAGENHLFPVFMAGVLRGAADTGTRPGPAVIIGHLFVHGRLFLPVAAAPGQARTTHRGSMAFSGQKSLHLKQATQILGRSVVIAEPPFFPKTPMEQRSTQVPQFVQ
jgi:hypothetical protein